MDDVKTAVRRELAFYLPLGILFLVISVLGSDMRLGAVGIILVAVGLIGRYRPAREFFLVSAAICGVFSCGLMYNIIFREANWLWTVGLVALVAAALSCVRQYRRFVGPNSRGHQSLDELIEQGQQFGAENPPEQERTPRASKAATWAAIFGILGVMLSSGRVACLGPPVAMVGLILGIIALLRIAKSNGQVTGRLLAVVGAGGFVVSAIVVFIILAIEASGFQPAVRHGDMARVRRMLAEEPGLVNARDRLGLTPLQSAARIGNAKMAELLVAKGAEVDAFSGVFRLRSTALYSAVRSGHKDVVQVLLAGGADANAGDSRGRTPLAVAIEKDDYEIAELLRNHGALEHRDPNSNQE